MIHGRSGNSKEELEAPKTALTCWDPRHRKLEPKPLRFGVVFDEMSVKKLCTPLHTSPRNLLKARSVTFLEPGFDLSTTAARKQQQDGDMFKNIPG